MSAVDKLATEWRGRKVLVTGGAGFIGSHLVDALATAGAKVTVLDDLSNGRRDNLRGVWQEIRFLEGSLLDRQLVEQAVAGAEVLFHQAALGSVPRSMRDPATTIEVNVAGTAIAFAAARDAGVSRVVYASSSSVYGDSAEMPRREGSEGKPLSPYAASKVMNEQLAEVYGQSFDMQLIGLRYFNIYGPRQSPRGPYAAVVPLFFEACRAGEAPTIHGDGEQSRDFTWVGDAVRANLLAALAPAAACGRAYNVGAGRGTTVNRLAYLIRQVVGEGQAPAHGPDRPGDVRDSLADLTAIGDALGYRPEVAVEEGLERTHAASPTPH